MLEQHHCQLNPMTGHHTAGAYGDTSVEESDIAYAAIWPASILARLMQTATPIHGHDSFRIW